MASFLRRPGNIARYSRRAAQYAAHTKPSSAALPQSQLSYLITCHHRRLYATINPGDPNSPNDKRPGQNGSEIDKKASNASSSNSGSNGGSPSPGGGNGGNNDQKPPDSKNVLTEEENKELDRVGDLLKRRLPEKQSEYVMDGLEVFRREGLPDDLKALLKETKGVDELSLAMTTKLFRVFSKHAWRMASYAADKDMERWTKSNQNKDDSTKEKRGESGQSQNQENKGKQGQGNQDKPPFGKGFEFRFDAGNFVIAAFLSYYVYRSIVPGETSKDITWQEFRNTFFDKGLVEKLTVVNQTRVRVELHREAVQSMYPDSPGSRPYFHYYFTIGSVEAFERRLEDAQNELGIPSSERIPVAYVDEVPWLATLLSFGPTLLLIGSFFWLSRRAAGGSGGQGGIFGMGKSRAKRFNHESDIKTKFADVAGMDEAKVEIMEFVSFLKKPEQFERLGAKIPRGAILSGPPGTGKTLLAKATAGESGVPFFSVSGSEFVEMFVGVGPSRVRDLFATARKNTPCIIFIDEIDAIGKSRAKNGMGAGNDERESTLNQILTEMDGFNTSEQVVVLAGTNRADVLDKALMRPGRFDRHISIDRPTMDGRKQIFAVHLKKIVTNEDVEYLKGRLAALTPGFSGADIANCVNEAALVGE